MAFPAGMTIRCRGQRCIVLDAHPIAGGEAPLYRLRVRATGGPLRNREWPVGKGHVGLAAQQKGVVVSPNLRDVADGADRVDTDQYYRSVICAPIPHVANPGEPAGVLVVTSSRQDHFRTADQAEARTAESFAYVLALSGVLGAKSKVEAGG